MGNKDAVCKDIMSQERYFLDAVNNGVFAGKKVVRKVETLDPEERFFFKDNNAINRTRDILKKAVIKTDGSAIYAIIGIENQSEIHYAMCVKSGLYDMLQYNQQVENTKKKNKKKKVTGAEFLSGFRKQDTLLPVITLVIYYGPGIWDGARRLTDMFHMPQELKAYVNDYALNLIVPAEIEDFDKFETDLGKVFEILKYSENKNKMEQIIKNDPRYQSMENDSVRLINIMANTNFEINKKEEQTNMCKAMEEIKKRERTIGLEKGIEALVETMHEFGQPREIIVKQIEKKFSLTREESEKAVERYLD